MNAVRIVKAAVSKTGLSPCGIQRTLRSGLVAMKMGMTATWDQFGCRHSLTLLQVLNNQVVQIKKPDVDGYSALQIGAFNCPTKNVTKPLLYHFQAAGVPAKRVLKEFRVTEDAVLPVGTELSVRHFLPGQYIDVTGISIGKGFQGAMKRWGFSGGPASHGASKSHRSLGSTGHRKTPSRTWKNKKMHGRMGCDRVTTLNLLIYYVDPVGTLAPDGWLGSDEAWFLLNWFNSLPRAETLSWIANALRMGRFLESFMGAEWGGAGKQPHRGQGGRARPQGKLPVPPRCRPAQGPPAQYAPQAAHPHRPACLR